MAADSFTETLIFKGNNGKVVHMRLTCSDVVGEYATAPDGQGHVQIPSDQSYALIDAIVVDGGEDTNNQEIYANGLNTGLVLDNKSNLNTSNFRQFATAPVTFAPGTQIRLKQSA